MSGTGFTASNPANSYLQTAVVTDQRLRKRTAARAQKLYGDLYLMAGRLSDAVTWYFFFLIEHGQCANVIFSVRWI